MTNDDNDLIQKNQTVSTNWEKESMDFFIKSLRRYRTLLTPHNTKGNKTITEEVKKIDMMMRYFRSAKHEHNGRIFTNIRLTGESYGLLSESLHKYWAMLKADLAAKKQNQRVKGSLESEEEVLNRLTNLLQNEFWAKVERSNALVPDFHDPPDEENEESLEYNQQIVIGNLYGQAVFGDNFGKMVQNEKAELITELQELFKMVESSKDIPHTVKSDAIGDIQTLQSQTLKSKPNKKIINQAIKTLGVLADLIQVSQFTPQAMSHIDKIKDLIDKIL